MKKSMHIVFFLFAFVLLANNVIYAQSYSLNGTVTDISGDPLIGVVVREANSGAGTITDTNGQFMLTGQANSEELTITASYVGYFSETKRVNFSATTLDFILKEDLLRLDEIVVTGTSNEVNKRTLGNAISTLDSQQLENSGAESLDRALSGKVSGALVNQNSGNPAGGVSVTLRGNSTVYGSSDPLYIIDGVIIDNSSNELIDLGGYTQNRLVDINPQDIDHIEIIKGAAAAALYGSRASNGVVQIFTKRGDNGATRINFKTSFLTHDLRKKIEENREPFRFEEPNNANNANLIPAERYEMQNYIFRKGIGTDNNLSISGGSGQTQFYFSGSANYNEGIIDNANFTRYTSRLNLDQQITKKITASIGLNYSNSKSQEIPNGGINEFYGALTGFNFNNNFYNPEPDADGNYESPIGFVSNPLEVVRRYDFGQKINRFNGNIKLDYEILGGLNLNFIAGLDNYTQNADGYIPVGTTGGNPTGWARTASVTNYLANADLTLLYKKTFGKNIHSSSLLGGTLQRNTSKSLGVTSNNLSPIVNSTSAGTIIAQSEYNSERNIQGAYLQESLGFNDIFFVTGAIRMDESSSFGSSNRLQFYPKISASYLLSELTKIKENKNINQIKLRASYGQSGNLTALSAYERFSTYNPTPINGVTGLVPSTRQGNEDIAPERQKELEFGFDLGFFDNRLGLEFSYYNVTVDDLLLLRTKAPSTTFQSRLENVGKMTNKGVEFLLQAVPVQRKNTTWLSSVTFGSNKNKVQGIQEEKIALPKSFGVSVAQNGYALGVLDGFIYERNPDGSILLNDQGLPSRAIDPNTGAVIRQIIGDPNPEYQLTWTNEVDWKKFNFRAQFDAVQGFDVFNFTDRVNSRSSFGGGRRDAQEIRGELVRGYNNAAYNIWERYIEDGSFIKLRELSVGYVVQPKVKQIQSLRFSFSGRNLFSIDDYTGWDPEISTAGQTNGVRGFDFNEVPIPRTLVFGINANF